MVSFIVPIYNAELYLDKCISSILNQVNQDFELILVYDGSKDNSLKICEVYAKHHASIKIINQENQGVSNARKKGLNIANGDYIVYVDADDFISNNYSKLVIENNLNSDIIFISGNLTEEMEVIIDDQERLLEIKKGLLWGERYGNCWFNAIWSKAYSRDFLLNNKIEFNDELSHGEDLLYNFEVIQKAKKIVLIKEVVYFYRINSNSVTQKYQTNLIENDIIFYERLYQLLEKNNDKNDLHNQLNIMLMNSLWIILNNCIFHRDNKSTYTEKIQISKRLFGNKIYKDNIEVDFKNEEISKIKILIIKQFLKGHCWFASLALNFIKLINRLKKTINNKEIIIEI